MDAVKHLQPQNSWEENSFIEQEKVVNNHQMGSVLHHSWTSKYSTQGDVVDSLGSGEELPQFQLKMRQLQRLLDGWLDNMQNFR